MNPFEIHGPIYLLVYSAVCGTAYMLASGFKRRMLAENSDSTPDQISQIASSLDPYEAAYLAGGSERVFLAACAALGRHKLIEVGRVTNKIFRKLEDKTGQFKELQPIELALLANLSQDGEAIAVSRARVANATSGIVNKLTAQGLIPTSDQMGLIVFLPAMFYVLVALFFSLPKCVIASQLHLPFAFLLVEMVIALAFTFKLYRKEGEITAKGKAVHEALLLENSALRLTHATAPDRLSLRDSALAYGVFGALAVVGDPFMDAQYALHRNVSSSSSGTCGTGCGSSCGGGCGGGCGG